MFRHIGTYFIALAVAMVTVSTAPVFAVNGCEPGKSLFVNISSERPSTVQIALVVAGANAQGEDPGNPMNSGQSADIQLFFSNAAASYAINMESGLLTKKQLRKLNKYLRKEFGYSLADIARLQGGDVDLNGPMPDISSLQQTFGARVFACSLCVADALTAAGVDGIDPMNPQTLMPYLFPDVVPMSPSAFYLIYDRIEEGDPCRDITAGVISF